jgi:hypothetical protein
MAGETRRVTVGFQGGQVLALRLAEKSLSKLYDALGGEGWHQVETEDGPVRVDVRQIVYVSADADEQHVGFG